MKVKTDLIISVLKSLVRIKLASKEPDEFVVFSWCLSKVVLKIS